MFVVTSPVGLKHNDDWINDAGFRDLHFEAMINIETIIQETMVLKMAKVQEVIK